MNRILVSGSLAYDRIMDFPGEFKDHFLPERLHSLSVSFAVSPPVEQLGGTGGNIAYNLAMLEETPEIIGTAGTDFVHYRQHLMSMNIDPETIELAPNMPTAAAYINTDEKDNQIAAISGAAGFKPYARPIDMKRYAAAVIGAGCIEDMQAIPELCRTAGIPYFFDPGQQIVVLSAEQLLASIAGATVILGNDYEIKMIEEKAGLDESGLLAHAGAVVITYGAEGSRILTQNGETRIPSVRVDRVLDPTGAGDAYRAGFIKGFLAKQPFPICGKIGSTAGAYAVERYGTQNHRFTMEEFRNRYQAAYGEACPV